MRSNDQRGSATIYTAIAVMVLAAVAVAVLGFAGLATTKHRAGAAADLAALAGATAASAGDDACGSAAQIAMRNGAHLVDCVTDASVVTVVVSVPGPTLLGRSISLRATSRAGPSTLPGS